VLRIAEALKPSIVVPIHTLAPHVVQHLIPRTVSVSDGAWIGV